MVQFVFNIILKKYQQTFVLIELKLGYEYE
jgi:hypothetical protein